LVRLIIELKPLTVTLIIMTFIPFDQRDGTLWLNGEMLPWKEAKVSVLTHGLHYGSSIFEGLRAYNGKIFKLQEHTDRLFRSADIMEMWVPYNREDVNAACEQVLAESGLKNAYIRPVMWRGAEQLGVAGMQTKIHVAVAAWDWGQTFSDELMAKGIELRTAAWRRPPPDCAPFEAKAAGLYMIGTLAKRAAEKNGYQDCLFLDWRGQVAEATAANMFLVMDGKLHTPIPDCFLNGITRQTVIELAENAGIEVIERAIMPEEFARTQEVFLTGSAYEIIPVGKIDQYEFTVGPMTKKIQQLYYQAVGKV